MKIVAARIRNFKLLCSIDLAFSVDSNQPLTVIRAENGSGKTSTLQALRWALYGKEVLDNPQLRLSPAHWPEKTMCRISVEIDFIHTKVSDVSGEMMFSQADYMLQRKVEEKPEGDQPNRGKDVVSLYEKTPSGAQPVDGDAESLISQMLPKEMIDIFFIYGPPRIARTIC